MGLHKGSPKMKFGSWYYPKGDERREMRPAAEYERVAEPEPITAADLAAYREAYADHVYDRAEEYLVKARYTMVLKADHWDHPMGNYMRAYAQVVRALEMEPDPFTTPDSPVLTELFWDLKAIRLAFEQGASLSRLDKIISDLLEVIRHKAEGDE